MVCGLGCVHGVCMVCAWCVHCIGSFLSEVLSNMSNIRGYARYPPSQTSSLGEAGDRRALSSCVADSVARTTPRPPFPSQLMLRKAAASAVAAAAFAACSAAAAACDAVKKPPATPPPPAAAAAKKPAEPKSMAELQLGLATKQRRVFVTAGIDDESAKVIIEQLTHG